jgi:hypothetical protein
MENLRGKNKANKTIIVKLEKKLDGTNLPRAHFLICPYLFFMQLFA